jgi:peroxiredoxin Q/BCP
MTQLTNNKLSVGDKAPQFKATNVFGKEINLKDVQSRYLLLVFFRYAGCPWCDLAIHRLSMEYATLKENGCEVIAFVQSDKATIDANFYNRKIANPEFSIVADHERKFYSLYGVNDSIVAAVRSIKAIPLWLSSLKGFGLRHRGIDGSVFLVPASFLIDTRSGRIKQVAYGSSYYEPEAFMDIYGSVFYKEL